MVKNRKNRSKKQKNALKIDAEHSLTMPLAQTATVTTASNAYWKTLINLTSAIGGLAPDGEKPEILKYLIKGLANYGAIGPCATTFYILVAENGATFTPTYTSIAYDALASVDSQIDKSFTLNRVGQIGVENFTVAGAESNMDIFSGKKWSLNLTKWAKAVANVTENPKYSSTTIPTCYLISCTHGVTNSSTHVFPFMEEVDWNNKGRKSNNMDFK